MTYGAYLDGKTNIGRSAVIIASADTIVAILSGLIIFPLVFYYDLDLGSGPGLIFVTLPIAFGEMHKGHLRSHSRLPPEQMLSELALHHRPCLNTTVSVTTDSSHEGHIFGLVPFFYSQFGNYQV